MPERIAAAVLQQSIGLDGGNRQLFYDMFDAWADNLKETMPDVTEAVWSEFRENMYAGDFVFNVSEEFVATCPTPMLVLMGDDPYHPQATSRTIAQRAPNATLVERWKSAEEDGTVRIVIDFLKANTP